MRPWRPVRGIVEALERRMILDVVRRLAVRDLPDELALVQIERRDAAVRRLDERQTLHGQAAAAFAAATAAAGLRRHPPPRPAGLAAAAASAAATSPLPASRVRRVPPRCGVAFGSRAVPCTQSKSDRAASAGTRPSGVGDVFEKM